MTQPRDMNLIGRCMMYEALADALEAGRNAALRICTSATEEEHVRATFKIERARLTAMWVEASGIKIEPIPASVAA